MPSMSTKAEVSAPDAFSNRPSVSASPSASRFASLTTSQTSLSDKRAVISVAGSRESAPPPRPLPPRDA